MAFRGLILVMFLFTVLWDRTMAQSGCTNALISMAPCLSYVTGSLSSPSSSCCSQLASVVQSQPICLCTALGGGGGGSLGVTINRTLALELPGACNVETPPSSRCNAADGPTMSPSESPGALLVDDRPVMSPSGSPIGSPMTLSGNTLEDAGSKAVPSAGGGSIPNDAIRITKMPLHQLVLSSLFMASYILTSSRF